jgi:hypothetical protein
LSRSLADPAERTPAGPFERSTSTGEVRHEPSLFSGKDFAGARILNARYG